MYRVRMLLTIFIYSSTLSSLVLGIGTSITYGAPGQALDLAKLREQVQKLYESYAPNGKNAAQRQYRTSQIAYNKDKTLESLEATLHNYNSDLNEGKSYFGPEFTFKSKIGLLKKGSDKILTKQYDLLNQWSKEVEGQGLEAVRLESDKSSDFTLEVSKAGKLQYTVGFDQGVIEIVTPKLSLEEIRDVKTQDMIQKQIFEITKNLKFKPEKTPGAKSEPKEISAEFEPNKISGGGHIHLGIASTLHGDPLLVRNMMVDLENHSAMFLGGIATYGGNGSVSQEEELSRKLYMDAIEQFDREVLPSTDEPLVKVSKLAGLLQATGRSDLSEREGNLTKAHLVNIEHLSPIHIARGLLTMEIRGFNPQTSAKQFELQTRLLDARAKYLSQSKGPIQYVPKKLKPVIGEYDKNEKARLRLPDADTSNQQEAVDQFHDYLTECGLDYSEFKELLLTEEARNLRPRSKEERAKATAAELKSDQETLKSREAKLKADLEKLKSPADLSMELQKEKEGIEQQRKEMVIRAERALKSEQENRESKKQALQERLDKLKKFDNILSKDISGEKRAEVEKLRNGVLEDIEELEHRTHLFDSIIGNVSGNVNGIDATPEIHPAQAPRIEGAESSNTGESKLGEGDPVRADQPSVDTSKPTSPGEATATDPAATTNTSGNLNSVLEKVDQMVEPPITTPNGAPGEAPAAADQNTKVPDAHVVPTNIKGPEIQAQIDAADRATKTADQARRNSGAVLPNGSQHQDDPTHVTLPEERIVPLEF